MHGLRHQEYIDICIKSNDDIASAKPLKVDRIKIRVSLSLISTQSFSSSLSPPFMTSVLGQVLVSSVVLKVTCKSQSTQSHVFDPNGKLQVG